MSNPKYKDKCPACQSEQVEYDISVNAHVTEDFHLCNWNCAQCKTVILTNGSVVQSLHAYFMYINCNEKLYCLCFRFDKSAPGRAFSIEYKDNHHGWKVAAALDFHPNINAHNIQQKLKIILTFC